MKEAVAILCAGGPAPGIKTVISSVTKIFTMNGYNVLGLNGGYKSLFSDEPSFEYLDFEYADQIYSRGGSALKMSRYKPKDEEFKVDFFKKHNVKLRDVFNVIYVLSLRRQNFGQNIRLNREVRKK